MSVRATACTRLERLTASFGGRTTVGLTSIAIISLHVCG